MTQNAPLSFSLPVWPPLAPKVPLSHPPATTSWFTLFKLLKILSQFFSQSLWKWLSINVHVNKGRILSIQGVWTPCEFSSQKIAITFNHQCSSLFSQIFCYSSSSEFCFSFLVHFVIIYTCTYCIHICVYKIWVFYTTYSLYSLH